MRLLKPSLIIADQITKRRVMKKNIDKLVKLSKKPKLFKRSDAEFWNDPHISKKMLEAHLNQ